jgi:biopolymer transport protein ExbB
MWEMIEKGGPLMGHIILCSVIAFAVFIERMWFLRKEKINAEKFVEKISDLIRRNRIVEAIDVCNTTPGPVSRILKMGILRHDRTREEIREAIQDAGLYEVPRLEKNIGILATVAHISPLLGLLGTVTGMVGAFQVIQQQAVSMMPVNPGDLAGGIWEALITTVAGLSVAIPTYVAYNYLVSNVDGFVFDMEKSATEIMNVLAVKREIS